MHFKAFLFFPQANVTNSGPMCPEFAGTFDFFPTVGQAPLNPRREWRLAIGPKLAQIGRDWAKSVVVTLVPSGRNVYPIQNITFDHVKVVYM